MTSASRWYMRVCDERVVSRSSPDDRQPAWRASPRSRRRIDSINADTVDTLDTAVPSCSSPVDAGTRVQLHRKDNYKHYQLLITVPSLPMTSSYSRYTATVIRCAQLRTIHGLLILIPAVYTCCTVCCLMLTLTRTSHGRSAPVTQMS